MSKLVTVIAIIVTLLVGLAGGYFIGRWSLDRQWRQPQMMLDGADRMRMAADDADPVPPAGTKLLKPMPLERSRLAMKDITKNDPVIVSITSFGNGDEGSELHLDVVNGGKCVVTGFSGVAYGFDAWGTPQMANKSGEHFVAFSAEKIELEPGKHQLVSQKLRYPETISLGVAQIDSVTCKGAPPWSRQ
jgi:hypothetical protein